MGNWPHIRAARLHAQNAPSARSAISHMGNRPHIPAAPNFPPAPQAEPVKNAARNTAFSVICGQRGCPLATARTAAVACAAAQLIPQTVPVVQEPAFRGLCASIAVRNMAIYIRTSLKHLNDRLPVGRKDLNTYRLFRNWQFMDHKLSALCICLIFQNLVIFHGKGILWIFFIIGPG